MARRNPALSVALIVSFAALAIQMAFGGPTLVDVGKCKYALSLKVNSTHAEIKSDAGKSKEADCGVKNITVSHLFPNGSAVYLEQLQKLYQGSSATESSLILTPSDIGSQLKLDGSACIDLPLSGLSSFPHLCQFKQVDTSFFATLVTDQVDGGKFDEKLTNTNSLDLPAQGLPTVPLGVVTECGNTSSHIVNQTKPLAVTIPGISGNPYADVVVTHVIVKTKNFPEYKVVDLVSQNLKPFAQQVVVPATPANGTAPATPASPATGPACYNIGTVTYKQLVHDPDAACWGFGCDVLLVVKKGNAVGLIQTTGFDTEEFILTKGAIGLIIGLVVGLLILCACVGGIVYLCKKKSGHQPLVEQRH